MEDDYTISSTLPKIEEKGDEENIEYGDTFEKFSYSNNLKGNKIIKEDKIKYNIDNNIYKNIENKYKNNDYKYDYRSNNLNDHKYEAI